MATEKIDEASLAWVEEQEKLMGEGEQILKDAHEDALEYLKDAVEHLNDRAWRKMAMSTQIVEMGVGVGMAEHLFPVIYKDMERTLHKKLKISKETARALRHIYIARVIKNVRRELNARAK